MLANEIVEKPAVLFKMLKSNDNWPSVAKKGEVTLSTKSIKDMENIVKYDVWYIENWTLLLDFKLIFLTIINLIKGSDNAV